MREVILASSAPQRKELLSSINIPFRAISPNIDEKAIRDPNPAIQAEKIARAKAERVLSENDAVVIAADTFAVVNGEVLEKPVSSSDARRMLKLQSENTGVVHTGFCYIDREKEIDYSTTISVEYTYRKLSEEEINCYIVNYPVERWAAGISPAHMYPMTFISTIRGSLTSFVYALPMDHLIPLLEKSGFNPTSREFGK